MKRHDRRDSNSDRRNEDMGPPSGWRERRKSVERRIPITEEICVSEAEWEMYFGESARQSTTATLSAHAEALHVDIFDRIRN